MNRDKQQKQVISRDRVANHGEVYTAQREVNAMLDLVRQETERIESRFLEPACGNGNFLIEVLRRKLCVVENRYKDSQLEYEWYAVLAVSSLYGIDILEDNVIACRNRLYELFLEHYKSLYHHQIKDECCRAVRFILDKNIIHGDALTLNQVGPKQEPIIFSEWSPVSGNRIKRRDFAFHELIAHQTIKSLPLFSDLGNDVFIPEPIREYPLVHFLRVADAEQP
jgi:hypothetical protein